MSTDSESPHPPLRRAHLEQRNQAQAEAADVDSLPVELGNTRSLPRVRALERPKSGPMSLPSSYGQQRLWFLWELDREGARACNVACAYDIQGDLDIPLLKKALNLIVGRHETLRTGLVAEDGELRQVVLDEVLLSVPVIEIPEEDLERRLVEGARWPFDLKQAPLLRAMVFRLTPTRHVLALTIHQTIADRWSLDIMVGELGATYTALVLGQTPQLPEILVQYADFAAWQRESLGWPELEKQLSYWRQQLAGVEPVGLPSDHPRPHKPTYRGKQVRRHLGAELVTDLRRLSQEEGATLYMVLLAALGTLLYRLSGQEDLVIGSPVPNRPRPELEPLIGSFANTLALRCDLAGNPSFRELLRRIRETTLAAYGSQEAPFERIVEEVQPKRDLSRPPLIQVVLSLQSAAASEFSLGQAIAYPVEIHHGMSRFDLSLELEPVGDTLSATLEVNADLFGPDTARRMLGCWNTLLEGIAEGASQPISELPILTQTERRRQLVAWNATDTDFPASSCIHDLVSAQAEDNPDKVAVAFGSEVLTYGELELGANRVAHRLRSTGAGTGTVVALCLERSLDMVVAMLGTLKSGAAYLPLDPHHPVDRLAFMLEDSGATVLLTQGSLLNNLPPHGAVVICVDREPATGEPALNAVPLPAGSAEELAYVIYTSGSTGKPKGVAVRHRNVVNLMTALVQKPGPNDTVMAVTPYSFDVFGGNLWVALGVGATVVLASLEVASDGAELGRLIGASGATFMGATPATWQMLVNAGWSGQTGLVARCGGEELTVGLAHSLLDRTSAVWNLYGPTETTVWSMCERIQRDAKITIGRPIANTKVYVLDERLEPVPVGVAGELFIGGAGVARGYINSPELTAERFLPNPFVPGDRIYRTGDRARFLSDGRVEYLGRLDYQIKIHGFRIEPGEVEATIESHRAVRQAVVVAQKGINGDTSLVAYVVSQEVGREPTAAELRAVLMARLPTYMVPSAFVMLRALPLTPNGKVDRRALPLPDYSGAEYVAPRSELEIQLTGVFARVLGMERVGIEDDFFDLGGHSLLAALLLRKVESEVGERVPLASMFQGGATVAGMAGVIEAGRGGRDDLSLMVPIQSRGTAPILFFVQPDETSMLTLRHFVGPLGSQQRVLGLLPERLGRRFDPSRSIEELAASMLATIRATQPTGPYLVAGYSLGGLIAYEIAGQMHSAGWDVAWLGVLDAEVGQSLYQRAMWSRTPGGFMTRLWQIGPWKAVQEARKLVWHWLRAPLLLGRWVSTARDDFDYRGALVISARYNPAGHEVPMDLFTSADNVDVTGTATLGWDSVHRGPLTLHTIPGKHLAMLTEPNVRVVAEILSASLRRALAVGEAGVD
jgi:amino acid adenylation domain-containing protein